MLHRVCLVAARSSNRRHFETHQPLAEAAGRSSRSFRYRCVVSSVQAFLSLYCSFQISYPGLGCPSLFGNQRSKPGSYSLSTLVSFPVSILSLRYYKSTASPSLLGRPSLASHSVLEPFDPPHRDPFLLFFPLHCSFCLCQVFLLWSHLVFCSHLVLKSFLIIVSLLSSSNWVAGLPFLVNDNNNYNIINRPTKPA